MSRPGSFASLSPAGQALARNLWRQLADELRRAALQARDGEPLPRQLEAELRRTLKRTGAAELPLQGESPRQVRLAFLAAAEALLLSAGERRRPCADLAIAACDCLEALLDAQMQADAASWQGRYPE